MAKKQISEVGIGLLTAFVGLFLLLAFYMYNMDMKWVAALMVLILGFIVFQQIRDKRRFLLHLVIFLLPFTAGTLYSILVKATLVFAFDMILFLLVGWWIFETHGLQTTKLQIHRSTIPAFLMVIWAGLAIVLAVSRMSTAHGVFLLFKAFVFYFFIINNIKFKKQLQIIVNMLLIGIGIQGLLGILQKVSGRGLGLKFLGEEKASMSYATEISRVRGTLGFPNQYGAYIILILPIALSFYFTAESKKEKMFYGGITFISTMGLFLSLSRSSWFGIIGALFVILYILNKQKKLNPKILRGILAILVFIVIIVVLFWDVIMYRFETGEKGEWRTFMIDIALPIIMSHPILGVGLFNYQYHSFSSFEFWHPVHNETLRIAAEMGVPGLLLFVWFVVIIYKEAFKNLRLKDPYLQKLALGVIGGYTAFLIAVQFGPQYQHYRQKTVFWILAALMVVSKRIAKNELLKKKRLAEKKRAIITKPIESSRKGNV